MSKQQNSDFDFSIAFGETPQDTSIIQRPKKQSEFDFNVQTEPTEIEKTKEKTGYVKDVIDILDAPIVSPRIAEGVEQIGAPSDILDPSKLGETATQQLAGTLNVLVGSAETLFSPVSKLFQIGTRSLTEVQKQIEDAIGLESAPKVGELIDKSFELAAETPQAGAELLDKGFAELGVPREVLNLGLSEEEAGTLASAIGGASSLMSQIILAKKAGDLGTIGRNAITSTPKFPAPEELVTKTGALDPVKTAKELVQKREGSPELIKEVPKEELEAVPETKPQRVRAISEPVKKQKGESQIDFTGEKIDRIQDKIDLLEDTEIAKIQKEKGLTESEAISEYLTKESTNKELNSLIDKRNEIFDNTTKEISRIINEVVKSEGLPPEVASEVRNFLYINEQGKRTVNLEGFDLSTELGNNKLERLATRIAKAELDSRGLGEGTLTEISGLTKKAQERYKINIAQKTKNIQQKVFDIVAKESQKAELPKDVQKETIDINKASVEDLPTIEEIKIQKEIENRLANGDSQIDIAKDLGIEKIKVAEAERTARLRQAEVERPINEQTLPEEVTGIKNEVVGQERIERGLQPLVTDGKRKWGKVWDEAKQKIENAEVDPRKPQDIINNENLHLDTRQAILEYDKITLRNDINRIKSEIEKIEEPKVRKAKEAEQLQLEDALNENDIANKMIGSEEARGLGFRRNLVKDDYTFASVIQQARTANRGNRVPPETRARLETQANRISELEQKIKTLEESKSLEYAEKEFKKTQREAGLEQRKAKRTIEKESLDLEYNNLIKDFTKTQTLNVAFTADQIALFSKMTKNRASKGIKSVEGIVDEIYVDLANKVEGITKRDIRDAISGYGKYTKLSKDELNVRLRDLRRQGRLLSAIEDIQNNQMPKKSGLQREKLSERVKELTKQLNEAKKNSDVGEDVALKSYKTRLKNDITKYEEMQRTGNYYKPTKRETVLDAEAINLAKKRDFEKTKVDREIERINQRNKPTGTKIFEGVLDVASLPKSLVSGGEFSQTLRQGMLYSMNPFHAKTVYGQGGAFREQFKYLASEDAYRGLQKQIASDPNAGTLKKMGIDFTSLAEGKITAREEAFQSRLTKLVPWARPFERSFTGFLDKVRLDVGNEIIAELEKAGLTPKTDLKTFEAAGSWINNATGRGNFRTKELQRMFEQASPVLGIPLFSPRLIVSRMQLLNPYYYARLPKYVRKMAMKDMLGFLGTSLSVLGIAKAAGADVELDPRSADFLKAKSGNTRIDIFGGLQQFVVLAARIRTGHTKTASGKVKKIDPAKFPFRSEWDYITDFAQNKMSPTFQTIKSTLKGTKWNSKEPYGLDDAALNTLTPLYLKDLYEAIEEQGLDGAMLALPGFFGAGINTYAPKKKKLKTKKSDDFNFDIKFN